MTDNTKNASRTTVFDAKFCVRNNTSFSEKMCEKFKNGEFVSFDELGEFANTIKLTDSEKPDYDIIELSFLITNKNNQPLVMERGNARQLKKGSSILYSFTPTHLGPNIAVTEPNDLLPLFRQHYNFTEETLPELTLIGVATNVNNKTIIDEHGKEKTMQIRYYFIVLNAHFRNNDVAPIKSKEHDDITLYHIDWNSLHQGDYIYDSIDKKPVDRLVLDYMYDTYIQGYNYNNAKFIPAIDGNDGKLYTNLFHRYDVFISHASEDKKDFVDPFAKALQKEGLRVWYDNDILIQGDKLSDTIQKGINNSRYGVIIFSENFFMKRWPYLELEKIINLAKSRNRNILIPVWYKLVPGKFSNELNRHIADGISKYWNNKTDCQLSQLVGVYQSIEDILGIVTDDKDNPETIAKAIAYHIKSERKIS